MKRFFLILTMISMLAMTGCAPNASASVSDEADYVMQEETEEITDISAERNYIANKNSGKLHSIHCDSLPYEKNRIYFSTVEEAQEAGYTDKHRECMGE
ncbi:MAG: hypothetical protein NC302_00270 [Bacteroidales bacterium]|nr:hypothetical protein [Bacteroidales bacterium]MCM1414341.1 hypothetical protein [bacterium]MCM1422223.1 hypothetical protein [bacterium]